MRECLSLLGSDLCPQPDRVGLGSQTGFEPDLVLLQGVRDLGLIVRDFGHNRLASSQ